jgi:AIPR protein
MASNDQVILEQILNQQKADMEAPLSSSDIFERFATEQILKNYDASPDEIETGIVDGGNDGGIDSIYTFVNEELLHTDTDITVYSKRNIKIELFIIQSKTAFGFSELAIERLITVTNDLLNLSNHLSSMSDHYSGKLLQIIEKFRDTYKELSSRYVPQLHISYIYATLGDAQNIHPNVTWKKDRLSTEVMRLFSHCHFDFQFLGASELLHLYRKIPTSTLELHLLENATSTTFFNAQGYLCLVSLEKYKEFISNEEEKLRKNIFEANIRDYQGKVEVNEGIRTTLIEKSPEDFWWLNNGITIIASKGTIVGKTISLEDAQIVNGLQTSTEIYNYFRNNPRTKDERSILVRIIVTDDLASRDKIIKATNSQTVIPAASLHATDAVQRNIEDLFLLKGGLYYDRRKNFYKNQGISRDRILSIPYLAQAVMAIVFREPDNSRGKPSSLLKDDLAYERIFSDKYPVDLYWICARLMKIVDAYIKSSQANLPSEEKYNLGFHVAMYVAMMKMKRANYRPQDILSMDVESITHEVLSYCVEHVVLVFQELRKNNNRQIDVIAKNKESTQAVIKHFERSLASNNATIGSE